MNNYVIDLTEPPIPPPCKTMRESFFFGGLYETKESKKRTASWRAYIEEYGDRLREKRQNDKN